MAQIEDCPQDLRALARRVPVESRAAMTAFELTQRCDYASSILADADEISDPVKGDRKRSEAGRVLRAMSPVSYSAEMDRLNGEAHKARLNQDAGAEYRVMEEMRLLARKHPQPDPERVAMAGLIAAADFVESYVNSSRPEGRELPPIPPPMPSHRSAFTRRFGRAKRKTR